MFDYYFYSSTFSRQGFIVKVSIRKGEEASALCFPELLYISPIIPH